MLCLGRRLVSLTAAARFRARRMIWGTPVHDLGGLGMGEYWRLRLRLMSEEGAAAVVPDEHELTLWLPLTATFTANKPHALRHHVSKVLGSQYTASVGMLSLVGGEFVLPAPGGRVLLASLPEPIADNELPDLSLVEDGPDVGTVPALGRVILPATADAIRYGVVGLELGPGALTIPGHVVGVVVKGSLELEQVGKAMDKAAVTAAAMVASNDNNTESPSPSPVVWRIMECTPTDFVP